MIEVRLGTQRGLSALGWLKSHHTFSFSHYYDPQHSGFSDLLVINDDTVAPGQGFGTHPHRDMEIFSYVLSGALAHKDSAGHEEVCQAGDVQMMSAGSGVYHSEYNASSSEPLHFLQIWILPDRTSVTPRYQQRHFDLADKRGKLQLIIAPDEAGDVLPVYQDIRVYAGLFDGNESASLSLAGRYAYIHMAKGSAEVNGQRLSAGDGARVRDENTLTFSQGKQAEVLLFDLRPHESPTR
jgi:redox-sensitive bicupin YhaK (pirin superfamily)